MKNSTLNNKNRFYHKLINNEVSYSINSISRYKKSNGKNGPDVKLKQLNILKQKISSIRNCDLKKNAKQIQDKINNKQFTVKKLSTANNELYGSVKPTEISKIILEKEKLEIKPSMMQLAKEIKSLGNFKVKIDLHSQIQAVIDIKVIAEEAA